MLFLIVQLCHVGFISLVLNPGFPKLVSPKAKVGKTLFRPIKPTNLSIRMAYKGQSSFGKPVILFTNLMIHIM